MGWLATFAGGIYYVASGPKTPAAVTAAPPINAASSDEADFIKCDISLPRNLIVEFYMLTHLVGSSWRRLRRRTNTFLRNWAGHCTTRCIYRAGTPSYARSKHRARQHFGASIYARSFLLISRIVMVLL